MTDNPWDEFDDSNDSNSCRNDKHLNGFFSSKKKNSKEKNNCCSHNNNEEFDDGTCEDNFITDLNNLFKKIGINFKIAKYFQLFVLIFCAILTLWLFSGFYIIKQEESAIILRFGKYVRNEKSGLHYHMPYPIEEVIKEATTRVRVLKIGGDNSVNGRENKELGEGWVLTGDENIVNLELSIQWRIDDLKKFVFGVRDKRQTIYDAAQSAVREVVSKRKLASVLTSGRSEIEEETKQLLQQMLNSYSMGVTVLLVQMLKIDPPAQVINSFRDVQTARVDKESEINKAYKYKNDILPKAQGEAGKIIENARGKSIAIINKANGDTYRFNQVYNQYRNAPYVTRQRMYIETMEKLFDENNVTIVDENIKNVFLNEREDRNKERVIAAMANTFNGESEKSND